MGIRASEPLGAISGRRGLDELQPAAASPLLTHMMVAFITKATDPNVIVWDDPLENANRYLSLVLFGNTVQAGSPGNNVAAYTINANTNLLI